MNEHDIELQAAASNAMRPDWPLTSLRTFITKNLAHRPKRDVAVALAWIACETNTATPARVLEAGPWWRAAAVDTAPGDTKWQPPRRDQQCRDHAGQYANACGGCEADRLAADRDEFVYVPPMAAAAAKASARAALAMTCPCGIKPHLCKTHRVTNEPEDESHG